MYDEYDKELNQREEAGNASREEQVPNFVMRDAEDGRPKQEAGSQTGSQKQEAGSQAGSQPAGQSYQVQPERRQENQGYNWQNAAPQRTASQDQEAQNQRTYYQNENGQQNRAAYQGGSSCQSGNTYQGGSTCQSGNAYQSGGTYQSGNSYRENGSCQNSSGQNGSYQGGNGYQNSSSHQEPEKKGKKKGAFFKKAVGICAAAVLFGVISGGTMVGVNMLADSFNKETYPQVSSQEVMAEAETTQAPAGVAAGSNLIALDVSGIVEAAMPSVVAINNTMLYQSNSWWGMTQTYEVPSSGSGIIIGQNEEELLIATNNHVVEDSQTLAVVFIDDTSVNAAIKGTDPDTDLAVIAVPLKDIPEDTLSQITVAQMGNSDELKVGQGVIAIGNALGYGQSVTVGYVSALDRQVKTEDSVTRDLLQTDAAINPGNSGGALLNMKGEVIGINAAKYSSTDVEGIGYAIPISKAQDILDDLMTKRTRLETAPEGQEGYLGIQGLTVDSTMVQQYGMPAGVYVYGIIQDGAASKSELREKDIITKFDGQSVRTMAALQELLKYYKAGETVEVTVQSLEKGQYVERVISLTLGEKATLGQDTKKQ